MGAERMLVSGKQTKIYIKHGMEKNYECARAHSVTTTVNEQKKLFANKFVDMSNKFEVIYNRVHDDIETKNASQLFGIICCTPNAENIFAFILCRQMGNC